MSLFCAKSKNHFITAEEGSCLSELKDNCSVAHRCNLEDFRIPWAELLQRLGGPKGTLH